MAKEISLSRLLYKTVQFHASDPRDKIYACLGLRNLGIHLSETDGLFPDYEVSIQQSFINATKWILAHEHSLAIWGMNPTISGKTLSCLPSWVPDFSVTDDRPSQCAFSRLKPYPSPYSPAGDSELQADFPFEAHPNVLVLNYHRIDTIASVSSHAFPQLPQNHLVTSGPVLAEWTNLCATLCGQRYRTGDAIEQAFCRTLIADSTRPQRISPAPDEHYGTIATTVAEAVLNLVGTKYNTTSRQKILALANDGEAADMLNPLVLKLHKDAVAQGTMREAPHTQDVTPPGNLNLKAEATLFSTSAGRKFFVTKDGYIGIGPADATEGDEVHVLAGGKVPFIMRRVSKEWPDRIQDNATDLQEDLDVNLQLYNMIGETYVHGIMHGEALEAAGFEWRRIGIS